MISAQRDVDIPQALLTWHDLPAYRKLDPNERMAQVQRVLHTTWSAEARATVRAYECLDEQASWLYLEEFFEQHPDVVALRLRMDPDDALLLVQVQRRDSEEFCCHGGDGAGDKLENNLDDWVTNTDLLSAMVSDCMTRASWLDQAVRWLGQDWLVERERRLLNEAVPVSIAPRGPRTRV